MKITSRWLAQHGACPTQRALFRKLYPASKYPQGVTITLARLKRAARAGQQISWLAFGAGLLTPAAWRAYLKATEAMGAWQGYVEATAPALFAAIQASEKK